jgi:hypothetical protein
VGGTGPLWGSGPHIFAGCRWPVLESGRDGGSAWTAVGVLAAALLASFAAFFYLGMRIDGLGYHLASRIDAMSDRISAQTDRIGRQTATIQAQSWDFIPAMRAEGRALATAMQAPSPRIGITESTIQAQGRDLAAAIQAQGAKLGSRIDALTARMDEHLGRHAR